MKVKISQITINPIHDQIYLTNEVGDLVESMEKYGLLEPIIVTPEKIIISGHRRFLAAKFLKWEEIDVIIRNVDNENMEYTIITSNQHRQKKSVEVLNEIQRLYQNYTRPRGNTSDSNTPLSGKRNIDNNRQYESWYW
jgi:ParB family transcriptional regulator, chromosome partitioning protein